MARAAERLARHETTVRRAESIVIWRVRHNLEVVPNRAAKSLRRLREEHTIEVVLVHFLSNAEPEAVLDSSVSLQCTLHQVLIRYCSTFIHLHQRPETSNREVFTISTSHRVHVYDLGTLKW